MNYNTDTFKRELEKLGISISEEQLEQFISYYEMLIEKNKVMNLTAITDFDEVIEKHFIDSLNLSRITDRKWTIVACSALTKMGITCGLNWLSKIVNQK